MDTLYLYYTSSLQENSDLKFSSSLNSNTKYNSKLQGDILGVIYDSTSLNLW